MDGSGSNRRRIFAVKISSAAILISLHSETFEQPGVMLDGRRYMAKACTYSCQQCLDIDIFGKFCVTSSLIVRNTCKHTHTYTHKLWQNSHPSRWTWVKVGFHYPSSRPEFTGRVDGPRTRVHFLTPVNSGRELGSWTQVVETDL